MTLQIIDSGKIVGSSAAIDGTLTDDDKDVAGGVAGLSAGSELTFAQFPPIKEHYIISDDVLHSHDAAVNLVNWTDMIVKKTITINALYPTPSILRVSFELKTNTAGHAAYGQIYKNGVAFGTLRSYSGTAYTAYEEDLSFADGDTIELWLKTSSGYGAFAQNLRVLGLVDYSYKQAVGVSDVGVVTAWTGTNT